MRPVHALVAWLGRPAALPVVVALYALPRLLVLLFPMAPVSDAGWYFDRAVGLVEGMGYGLPGRPTAFWPVGWPATLAAAFAVFGPHVWVGKLLNFAAAMASGWLVYDLGRRLCGSALCGRGAVLLLALYPNNFVYPTLLLTEVFFTFLLLLACWLAVASRGWIGLALMGLVFGWATLIKTQTIVLLPVVLLLHVVSGRTSGQVRARLAQALVAAVCTACVVLPWTWRNHQVFGETVFVSTNGGLTLLTGNNPSANGDYTPNDALVAPLEQALVSGRLDELTVGREARRRAIEWIEANPGKFVALLPRKLWRLWVPDGESEWSFQAALKSYDRYEYMFRAGRIINQAYYFALMAGFVVASVGILRAWRELLAQRRLWWFFPLIYAAYLSAIALAFSGQSRFHFSLMPFVAIMCAALLTGSRVGRRTRPADAASPA